MELNNSTRDELIKNSYNYFPFGMDYNDPKYCETKEYCLLVEKIHNKSEYNKILLSIAEDALEVSDKIKFEDLSEIPILDRCVKGRFDLDNQLDKCYLMLYISLLIPFYVIYEAHSDFKNVTIDSHLKHDHVQTKNSKLYLKYESIIESSVLKNRPTYERLHDSLINIPVENITFNTVGKLRGESTFLPDMTIFNVFFSETYF